MFLGNITEEMLDGHVGREAVFRGSAALSGK